MTASALAVQHRSGDAAKRSDVGMLLTLARIPLGGVLLLSVFAAPIAAAVLLTVFVGLDIADGKVARRLGVESDARRVADGCIDRVTTCSCLIAGAALYDRSALLLVGVLVARELWLGVHNARLFDRGTVMKASAVHKVTSVGYATMGYALLLAPSLAMLVGAVAVGGALALTPLYRNEQSALSAQS